jgi:hypothetical protein
MHPQLEDILDEFDAAEERLYALAAGFPDDLWSVRPEPGRWSVSECIAHLNLTSQAYIPLLESGIAEAKALGGGTAERYTRDIMGWLLWRTMAPPARFRAKTPEAFVPGSTASPAVLRSEFARLQQEQRRCTMEADCLHLGRVKIPSPFDPRIRYNLYSCLSILPRHQMRHIWQAEQVAAACQSPAGAASG